MSHAYMQSVDADSIFSRMLKGKDVKPNRNEEVQGLEIFKLGDATETSGEVSNVTVF